MANFKVRKTGSDLHSIEIYNSYKDGKNSPFFPEYAPKSVGGTMSGVRFSNAKGNCTWYAFGRYQEVHGVRPPLPQMRRDAKYWGTSGEKTSDGPEVGGIVVFGDSGYGHVAFIEKISNGVAYLSESSYSERGNDFLFRYGRTIDDVKRDWGMTVLRYIAPAKPSTSYEESNTEHVENGVITVKAKEGLKVRQTPSLSGKHLSTLPNGAKKEYTHYVDADGIRWVKLKEGGYSARRTLDNKTIFADAEFKGAPTPKPEPAFKPYKYNLPKGSSLHDARGNAYDLPTEKDHTVTILKEYNGMGLIREDWLVGVSDAWVKLNAKPAPKPAAPKPAAPKKEYINLLPLGSHPQYGYYSLNDVPVYKNIRGYLTPNYYGGLSYEIKKRNSDGTVVVSTSMAGDVKLYVDSSRATITSSPKYGASSGGSSQKYVNFLPNNTNYILRHANNVGKYWPAGLNPQKHGGVSIPIVADLGNGYYTIKSSAFDPNIVAVLVDSRWSYVSSKADYKIL